MEEKNKKRQIAKISVFITSIFVIFMSVTYAFITQTLTGTKEIVINAGVLDLVLEEENEIIIENVLPMYDEVGMIQEDVFQFRLVNKTSNKADYVLKLNDITTGDKLDTSIVKYGLTKENEKTIDLLSNLTNGVIDKGTINGNDTINYTLRLWIDSKVTDETRISGKSLSYRIDAEVSQSQPYQVRYGELYSATIDGVQGGFIFNEDGSALVYSDYVQQEQFETGTFTFAGENIISSIGIDFKISEDGTELYLGEDSEQINLNLIEKGGDILFRKSYSITIDGATASITFNEDGSLFMNTPDGIETYPAGAMYYKDGSIYDSETDELMGYTLDNGNMINFEGMLFKHTYINYGTVKIYDDEYIISEVIDTGTGGQLKLYKITGNTYSKEDLIDSYAIYDGVSFNDALHLSSSFLDTFRKENFMIFHSHDIWYLIFVQEGCTYDMASENITKMYGFDAVLTEGVYVVDGYSVLGETTNLLITNEIENPILLKTLDNIDYTLTSYDSKISDEEEELLYLITDEYLSKDKILGTTLFEATADWCPFLTITDENITQISDTVYKLDGTYVRYFASEDTYIDSDNDGIKDTYYKKGISVSGKMITSSADLGPWMTYMKFVDY